MKLRDYALQGLAEMVVGDRKNFPYRSSYYITHFFKRCGLDYVHDGKTRPIWAKEKLAALNDGPCHSPDLPSDSILRIINELFDPDEFDKAQSSAKGPLSREAALEDLNKLLQRDGLQAYFEEFGNCYVRSIGTGINSSSLLQLPRPLSKEELAAREKVAGFLDSATEDEFTEKLLVPLFQRLSFRRVSAAGHKEKTLEFGKDLWMKYQIPTGHWLYFCAQVKRGKIDASGVSGSNNAANILTQVKMALDHPIFDPDSNRKVLLDHIFVIAAGEITRAARTWIVEHLDTSQRRHIIFMDRDELLDQSARILQDLQFEKETDSVFDRDNVPF